MIEFLTSHERNFAMPGIRYHAGRTYFTSIQPHYGPWGRRVVYSIPGIPTPARKAVSLGIASPIHVERYPLFASRPVIECCGGWVDYPATGTVTICPTCGSQFAVR